MRTISKTFLPEYVKYNNKIYLPDSGLTTDILMKNKYKSSLPKDCLIVLVSSRGERRNCANPIPREWIFLPYILNEEEKAFIDKTRKENWKEQTQGEIVETVMKTLNIHYEVIDYYLENKPFKGWEE